MTTPEPQSSSPQSPEPVSKDRVYRSPAGLAGGVLLLALALWLGIDAVVAGEGRTPWVALAALLFLVPLVAAYTVRPAVFANDDRLVIGLGELNDSGYTGIAVLEGDGEATDVTLYLVQAPGTPGTESAAQESAPASANAEAVEIKGFAYNPPTIEVPAGGKVWFWAQPNVATA